MFPLIPKDLNDGQNTESNKLTLMNYAKKVYGDFDTGENPKIYNNFEIWEKNQNLIIYKRVFNEESLIDEEIYISNNQFIIICFYYKFNICAIFGR